MKVSNILPVLGCAALLAFVNTSSAAQLVTNGDFSAGSAIYGGSPTGWNASVDAASIGQFTPGGGPYTPLSGQMAYLGGSPQIIQTFGVSLAANTVYTISFDYRGSVGDFAGTNTFDGFIGYGSGSGGTSAFTGGIIGGDLLSGQNAWAPAITTSSQSYSVSFTTPGTITGSADNLAIIMNPVISPAQGGYQVYLDNVSVTTSAVPEPTTLALLAAGLGSVVFLRRRRTA